MKENLYNKVWEDKNLQKKFKENSYLIFRFHLAIENYQAENDLHLDKLDEFNTILKEIRQNGLNYEEKEIVEKTNLCVLLKEQILDKIGRDNFIFYDDGDLNYIWKRKNVNKNDGGITQHKMKLQTAPFKSIKSGNKTIEMRLNDEKRKTIKIGDEIEFTNIQTNEKLNTRVLNIHKFKDFAELYKSFDKTALGYLKDEIAKPDDMSKYYSKEDIEKYGVVGIEIELI